MLSATVVSASDTALAGSLAPSAVPDE